MYICVYIYISVILKLLSSLEMMEVVVVMETWISSFQLSLNMVSFLDLSYILFIITIAVINYYASYTFLYMWLEIIRLDLTRSFIQKIIFHFNLGAISLAVSV